MPSTSQVIYQPYLAGARGGLKAGTDVPCRTPEEGIRRAERALAGGSILGAEVVTLPSQPPWSRRRDTPGRHGRRRGNGHDPSKASGPD